MKVISCIIYSLRVYSNTVARRRNDIQRSKARFVIAIGASLSECCQSVVKNTRRLVRVYRSADRKEEEFVHAVRQVLSGSSLLCPIDSTNFTAYTERHCCTLHLTAYQNIHHSSLGHALTKIALHFPSSPGKRIANRVAKRYKSPPSPLRIR